MYLHKKECAFWRSSLLNKVLFVPMCPSTLNVWIPKQNYFRNVWGYLRSIERAKSQAPFFNGRLEKNISKIWGCLEFSSRHRIYWRQMHLHQVCPRLTRILYHNYKDLFRMVLLAICDPGYCFTLFDFGSYGSNNDSDVLANSAMRKAF